MARATKPPTPDDGGGVIVAIECGISGALFGVEGSWPPGAHVRMLEREAANMVSAGSAHYPAKGEKPPPVVETTGGTPGGPKRDGPADPPPPPPGTSGGVDEKNQGEWPNGPGGTDGDGDKKPAA